MRSVVRLKQLKDCFNWVANTSKQSPFNSVIKLIPTICNGEGQTPIMRRRIGSPSLMDSHGIDKIVESTSEIVDAIPNYQSPMAKRRRFILSQEKAISGVIRICLFGETVRVSIHPGLDFILDGLSVLLAPSELGENVCKV